MVRQKLLVVLTSLLVNLLSGAFAGHLKVHVQSHQKVSSDEESPLDYIMNNWKDTYAVCVFHHPWSIKYLGELWTLGFFDRKGNLLRKYCDERDFDFDEMTDLIPNAASWNEEVIDDDSKCYMHEEEEKEAQPLMVSWHC